MNIITEKYISKLIQYQIIEEENKEIYMYGLECYILKIIHTCIFLAIGLLTDTFPNTIIFLMAYSLLRTYAGGYHANSLRKCFLFSIIISFTVVLTSYYLTRIEVSNIYSISLLIISLFVVGKFAPVDTEKKRHDLR
ncbi:accessory gene regulator ArgB-like protein [Anaerocolumna sp.]|uniref:accessory gene regulator ArgB-like protein n=1 Tax=Anaerocolumna sp. TaxID=2041569 RepID=UPI0028AE60A4|nr:accessory gene regulator B family protein [Anaerocolumna sp.]